MKTDGTEIEVLISENAEISVNVAGFIANALCSLFAIREFLLILANKI